MSRPKAIIIGAGPAGLTAAYELLDKTDIIPLVYEMTPDIGGLSKTVEYHGNRMDIGGHRFFSKSDRVMAWWQNVLPLQGAPAADDRILGRSFPLSTEARQRAIGQKEAQIRPAPDPDRDDKVMLVRKRLSRIYFLRKFFDYPVSLNSRLIFNLGLGRVGKIGVSYLWSQAFPQKPEVSLEDFFINRFGRQLYSTFFKDYTEKVWGIPCDQIRPEWGAQRVKGLSVYGTLKHALKSMVSSSSSIAQKDVETSLINQFCYPKFGPGQMWEEVAQQIRGHGGEVHTCLQAVGFKNEGNRIVSVTLADTRDGTRFSQDGDYFFSTMPVTDLIGGFSNAVPGRVRHVSDGLVYRDFMTVGLLLNRLRIRNDTHIKTINELIPDNWIYVQEREVKLGRIQVFNNWSPYLVKDPARVWLGLEYFCNEGDELWNKPDDRMIAFAADELAAINIIERGDVLDGVVVRMPKTYPTYSGTYEEFDTVRDYVDGFENLFLIGRNGMHRYNNADHSMLTAMIAVENIINGRRSRENIWSVNTEEEYHEET